MSKVTFTNALGDSIELLSIDNDYILNSVEGLGGDVSIQSQGSPNTHGSRKTNIKIESRELTIGFTVTGSDPGEISERRKYAGQVFNPSLGDGLLTYEIYFGVSYSIMCTPSSLVEYPTGNGQRGYDFQRANITLLADNPFWMDEVEREIELYAFDEGFGFPFEFPVEFGEQGVSETIYNTGHEPAPFLMQVKGPNSTPKIMNHTTGQFMEFNRSLAATETLEVHTKIGEKYARIIRGNGEVVNAMPYLTFESEFFSLALGENKLTYNAAAGTGETTATIKWTQLYNSI